MSVSLSPQLRLLPLFFRDLAARCMPPLPPQDHPMGDVRVAEAPWDALGGGLGTAGRVLLVGGTERPSQTEQGSSQSGG